ncbi:hypothetical protein J699_01611 [Acinetobacter sp. 1000160]|nr:hypothetical protein J522_0792 [Acinetobacter baumannii 146457]EYT21491.1 hypothetical protein J699_01611 [Acinetobacter sp. 1000160]
MYCKSKQELPSYFYNKKGCEKHSLSMKNLFQQKHRFNKVGTI